jgi:phosphatidylserine/phosphatidylglycerophosphate/cardiolipin synthase-like enzyme
MKQRLFAHKPACIPLVYFVLLLLLVGCNTNTISITPGNGSVDTRSLGSGVQGGVQVFVEPDAGDSMLTGAIANAKKSVWVEIYLLSERNIIRALEEAANRGIDVRVMLEPHPFGGGPSPRRTLNQLQAAGIKAQATSPSFTLTHEKGMVIDGTTAFIMTSNFTRSALGASAGKGSVTNREYDIVDSNPQDVQAVITIFNADWNHTDAQFNDSNLVVSPVNSRSAFTSLMNSAHRTLLIEAEEMNDSSIEQTIASAAQRGVHVQVILPAPSRSSGGSNSPGVGVIKQGGAQVKEDSHLYMHAKIIVVDGQRAFVGSENISTQSLDHNRELGIIVSDNNVLTTLERTFQRDWSDSQNV